VKKFNKFILKKKTQIKRDENGNTVYHNLWEDAETEINLLSILNHPNIINLKEIFENENNGKVYVIMDYESKGECVKWDDK